MIIGAGPIGILAAQTLAAWGVNVIISDLIDLRLAFARTWTRATVIDAKVDDTVERVLELTGHRGADFVVEMAANQIAIDQAFEMVRIRGTVVTIGTFDVPVLFNPFFAMSRREVRLLSAMGRTGETWRRMSQLIESEMLQLRPLIDHVLPLDDYARGFELVKGHRVQKVLLRP